MAAKDKLSHKVLGPFTRRIAPARAGRAAENYGYESFEKTLDQWIDSSGHRRNLLFTTPCERQECKRQAHLLQAASALKRNAPLSRPFSTAGVGSWSRSTSRSRVARTITIARRRIGRQAFKFGERGTQTLGKSLGS
jgi:hypothetical protein